MKNQNTNTTVALHNSSLTHKSCKLIIVRLIKKEVILSLLITLLSIGAFAQTDLSPASPAKTTYPKTVGYLSFIIPVVTAEGSTTTTDFTSATTIGFPVGLNVLYSDKFGFSYEISPSVKVTGNTSKMSNLVFDPGPMFRFKHGFTIITRLAFETSGRYGFTPVVNKVFLRTKSVDYSVSLSLPTRFGEDDGTPTPTSVGGNVQFLFAFN
jgi:hypothetical protein